MASDTRGHTHKHTPALIQQIIKPWNFRGQIFLKCIFAGWTSGHWVPNMNHEDMNSWIVNTWIMTKHSVFAYWDIYLPWLLRYFHMILPARAIQKQIITGTLWMRKTFSFFLQSIASSSFSNLLWLWSVDTVSNYLWKFNFELRLLINNAFYVMNCSYTYDREGERERHEQ